MKNMIDYRNIYDLIFLLMYLSFVGFVFYLTRNWLTFLLLIFISSIRAGIDE